MSKTQATELLAMAALANLPAHSGEARLICDAVIAASTRGGSARQRAQVFRHLLDQQAVNQHETQAEFAALLQTNQGQLGI